MCIRDSAESEWADWLVFEIVDLRDERTVSTVSADAKRALPRHLVRIRHRNYADHYRIIGGDLEWPLVDRVGLVVIAPRERLKVFPCFRRVIVGLSLQSRVSLRLQRACCCRECE